jgi:hypothetical protein
MPQMIIRLMSLNLPDMTLNIIVHERFSILGCTLFGFVVFGYVIFLAASSPSLTYGYAFLILLKLVQLVMRKSTLRHFIYIFSYLNQLKR